MQSPQARKSGENHYSFSIPLWFALRHHFFVEKMMSYVILGNDMLCRFLTKIDFFQLFLFKPFFDQVPKKGSALVKFINLSTRGECIEFGQYLPIKIKLFLSLSYMFFFISMFISESWEVAQSRKNWQIKNLFVNLYRLLTLIEKPCDFVEGLQLVTLSSL